MFEIIIALLIILILLELPQIITDTTAVTSYFANLVVKNNFHEIVKNKFYRAGKMSDKTLTEVLTKNKIKTVINLCLDQQFVAQEEEIVQALGIVYYHCSMTGSEILSKPKILDLISIYDQLETPVLVHCDSGTHRSGVATSIWLLNKESAFSDELIKKQLALKYGYFKIERKLKSFIMGCPTIDQTIWDYFDYKDNHREITLTDWVKLPAAK
ncbi:MAG: hypothetical protein LBE20_02555 [Deltaproteobacteria bacterium]|jgi:protein tyrosine phosphatase (PTP) superfamily phosphohydrolase (DUF442 family)|nr:hypothetical protein [Deltaproteobacteria bacterium]